MSINIRCCELEAILLNSREDRDPEELADMEEELFSINHIIDLWEEFGNVPMNPDTECIEEEWHGFMKGTHKEQIWHWFEHCFNVSVADDLMGQQEGIRTKKFGVEIVETYRRYVEIEAVDEDKAFELIDEKINDGEINLPKDGGDYKYDRDLFVTENKY